MRGWLWLSIAVIAVDQVTKHLAIGGLNPYEPVPVNPFFNLTLMYNTGAAFSFLSEAGGWQRWVLSGLALVVSGVLVAWLWRLPRGDWLKGLSLSLIVGGALGNAWDRLLNGYVIDFLDFYYQAWHWPAFNMADSAITVGAVLLLWDSLFARPGDEAAGRAGRQTDRAASRETGKPS